METSMKPLSNEPKSKNTINAKIDSGLKRPSSKLNLNRPQSKLTLMPRTRQKTQILNASKLPVKSSTPPKRAIESASAMRLSTSTAKPEINPPIRSPPSVHRLGAIPSYLKKSRPSTAHGKLISTRDSEPNGFKQKNISPEEEDRQSAKKVLDLEQIHHQQFRSNVTEQYRRYSASKEALNETGKATPQQRSPNATKPPRTSLSKEVAKICVETDQIDHYSAAPGVMRLEGEGAGDSALQASIALEELNEKLREMERLCKDYQEKLKNREDQLAKLQKEMLKKTVDIEERDNQIAELNGCIVDLRFANIPEDSPLEQTVADLRLELAQKSKDLILNIEKNEGYIRRLDDASKRMAELEILLEEREQRLFEQTEKQADKETAFEKLKADHSDAEGRLLKATAKINNLRKKLTNLTNENTDLKAQLEKKDPKVSKKSDQKEQLEQFQNENRIVLESLHAELKKLRYENGMLKNAQSQDNILMEIKSKLIDNLESSKATLKARCEQISKTQTKQVEEDESTHPTRQMDGFEALFKSLATKQRRCCKEEKIISDIEQNNRNCKIARRKMLDMLGQLKKENRAMRSIISSNPDLALINSEETNEQVKGQIINQLCQIFPEEDNLQQQPKNGGTVERITNRIIYDEHMIGGIAKPGKF
ncbi:kinesin-related protein 4-like isoform X2 [Uranotaenia lowii]|uniref:kinesin-related protein 4-like isoform X2 n=1 Tax=Uranotaenia lowii TaxID=190385 RepID=UPI00247AF6A5|nr:kinesin-related protein 4-like isoform X2 [Uranotaenia lowii]